MKKITDLIYCVLSINAITGKHFKWQYPTKEEAFAKLAKILNSGANQDEHIKVQVHEQFLTAERIFTTKRIY